MLLGNLKRTMAPKRCIAPITEGNPIMLPMRTIALMVIVAGFAFGQASAQEEPEKKIDPQGRYDALTLLFYPDTPRPKPKKTEQTLLPSEPEAPTPEFAWQIPLWEACETLVEEESLDIADPWQPQWNFFPAEAGATLTWLTIPLAEPIPEGKTLVAMMRNADNEEDTKILGSDDFPFRTIQTKNGWVAQASRALNPGRYALAAGWADDEGNFTPRYGDMQLIARVNTDQFRLSRVILAERLTQLEAGAEPGPFQINGFEVIPREDSVLHNGESLQIFYQILGASSNEASELDLDITYQIFLKNPKKKSGPWVAGSQPITSRHVKSAVQGWSLDIVEAYPPTNYKIDITVKDNVGGGTVTHSVKFSVEKP